jgi:hypothetical protein
MKYLGLFLAACVLLLTACDKPPQAEIDAATKAFQDASHTPDVLTYAPDSLRAAQEKLEALNTELDSQAKKGPLGRRYAQAGALAQEARAAAEQAVADGAHAKEQAKADAASLLENLSGAIPTFETKLWSAKRVRGIKLDQEILGAAEGARAAVADAQKDYIAGSFAAARAKALTVQEALEDTESRITEAVRLSRKR